MHLKNGLMLLSSFFIVSCAHSFGRKAPEPSVEYCLPYKEVEAWECLEKSGQYVTKSHEEMKGHIALPIDDAETYRKYCVRRRD
jgi:hypothetical protein